MEKINTVRISINWASILGFSIFFIYGIYGYITVPYFSKWIHVVISIVLLALFLGFLFFRKQKVFEDSITLRGKDIVVFVSYFIFVVLFSLRGLLTSIDGDQLYHAQQAMMPSIFGVQFLSNHFFSIVHTISYSLVVWGVILCIMCATLALCFFTKKVSSVYTYIGLGFLFLASRFFVLYAGGNGSAFPPLRLFPLWVSSTVFSPSSFGFRMAAFVGLIALMYVVWHYATKRLQPVSAYLLGLFAGTIPVVLHVGTLVEMSLWATFCLVFVLFVIDDWSEGKKIKYLKVISLIVIFSCMRISGFITLVPIIAMLGYDFFHRKINKKEVLYAVAPMTVLIPVIFASIYIGTPSSYHGAISFNPYIEAQASLFRRLHVAIASGTFFTNVYDSIRFPLVIVLALVPILVWRNTKKAVLVLSLFVMYFALFYSIEPGLWGNGRYQAEFVAPFIIYGVYLFSLVVSRWQKILIVVFCLVIVNNLYLFTRMSEMNEASFGHDVYSTVMKKREGYFVWSELPYNFKEALQSAKQDGFAGNLYYSPGNGYGYFAEILSGYTVSEMQQQKSIISRIGVGIDEKTSDSIIADKDIRLVLINGSRKNKETLNERLATTLQKNGWVPWREFTNSIYGTTMYGFKRVQ